MWKAIYVLVGATLVFFVLRHFNGFKPRVPAAEHASISVPYSAPEATQTSSYRGEQPGKVPYVDSTAAPIRVIVRFVGPFDWAKVRSVTFNSYGPPASDQREVFKITRGKEVIVAAFRSVPWDLSRCLCIPEYHVTFRDEGGHTLRGKVVAEHIILGHNWKKGYPLSGRAISLIRKYG